MGVATTELPSSKYSVEEIPATASSMSQGFHEGNIFSFSDEFERTQQGHVARQSRRDKLRIQQHGFEAAAAAAAAAGNPLVTIQEEEEETGGIYGPAGTSYMLSEMFNYPIPTPPDLHLAGQGATSSAAGYHRLMQQRPELYGGNKQNQLLISPSTTNWSSVLAEDAAAPAVMKHHGMNPDSSTAMRLFFMNPPAAEVPCGVAIQPVMQNHERSPSTPPSIAVGGIGVGSSLHHINNHPPHNQGFLGTSFSEGVGYSGCSGGVMARQRGPSLSLSSSALQQLEMRKEEDEMRICRSDQGGRFFLNSGSQQQEQQLHPNSIHQLLPPPPPSLCLQQQGQQNQGQQLHMSYGPVPTVHVFRNSKYARAAQDLLEEFCSVGRDDIRGSKSSRNCPMAPNPIHSRGGAATSSSSKDLSMPLSSSDRFEYQRKKSKLLSMLDEVERRYNRYCEQMQMVVNSFDTVMGFGAATPYTALAQKAMSRHFRCLKDAITAQLRQTCELLGEKDGGANASGWLTKGDTPKLRLIDQSLRQQRAFHQLGMMEQDQAWRPQRGLPDRSVTILRAWLFDHFLHPYPSDADKHLLARQTGLSRNQVSNWFINARVRLWKPMVEDMYQQEAREEEGSQRNEEESNSHGMMLAAAAAHQHQSASAAQYQTAFLQAADSDAPEIASAPRPNLRLAAPIEGYPQPPLGGDDAAASAAVIFSAGFVEDDMYRRAAALLDPSASAQARFGAAATARTGDLSLTLGLRHAGGNPPDSSRFGL